MLQLKLLLVESDIRVFRALAARLSKFGTIQELNRVESLPDCLSKSETDLIICGPRNGRSKDLLGGISAIKRLYPRTRFVILAAESSEELAIEALRAGAQDYFKAPFDFQEIAAGIIRLLQEGDSASRSTCSKSRDMLDPMVGNSACMEEVRNYARQLAATHSNVLVTGETGTGKELIAQSIHQHSTRVHKPFICINCAAVPDSLMESEFFGYERGAFTGAQNSKPGKLALANGGTVFLDEIGDMSAYMQAKMLRAIEGKEIQPLGARGSMPIDFRVIAATNQDLDRLTAENRFRPDLYFRLNVGRIHLPPLRERKEDIPLLIDHYLASMNRSFGRQIDGLSDGVLDQFMRYHWPGNIRELRNTLEAAYAQLPSEQCRKLDLPNSFRRRLLGSLESLPRDERNHLVATLSETKWNKSAAAQKLRWSRMTLYRKMAKYQITRGGSAIAKRTDDFGSDAA